MPTFAFSGQFEFSNCCIYLWRWVFSTFSSV